MKKIIAVLSIIAIICCLCSAVDAAEEGEDIDISITGVETSVDTVDNTIESATNTEPVTPNMSDAILLETEMGDDANEEPLGEWILRKIKDNATRIIAAVGALVCTMAYIAQKTKLFPAVFSFISTTKTNVNNMRSEVEGWKEDNLTKIESIKGEVQEIKNNALLVKCNVEEALATANGMMKQVKKLQEQQGVAQFDREVLKMILSDQVEMFNTIIQASTLAQWRKDEIGQTYENSKKLIATMTKPSDACEDGEEDV